MGVSGGGLAPGGAGDSGGHVPGVEAGGGVRPVQHGDCDGAGDWAPAGRMDHGPLELEVDFSINIPIGIVSLILTVDC